MFKKEHRKAGQKEAESWREPSYSQEYDTKQMYSPGIIRSDQMSNHRSSYKSSHGNGYRNGYGHINNERNSQRSGYMRTGKASWGINSLSFLRTACLVLLCVLLSVSAAYGVLEYRINRGDFNYRGPYGGINIIEFGGGRDSDRSSSANQMVMRPEGLAPEDIYEMAVYQVVGIRTDVPSSGLFRDRDSTTPLSGSGFIIRSDGYILTNYHVVEVGHRNNLPIIVSLFNGDTYEAEVVGFDSLNDIALIKIDATNLNSAIIGNSNNIRVGQRIYVVGNPFGELVYTMTDGIVSALDRIVTLDRNIINTFQLSAAVNSGNSGGPVYNINGEVIGIVTAKMVRGSVEGIGFAIPINDAIAIAIDLIEYGYISGRAFLGITTRTVNPGHADYFDVVSGALIVTVTEGAAAYNAGVLVGDIITQVDETEIESLEALRFALRRFNAGDTTNIVVWRGGESYELTITFDEDMHAGQPNRH